MKNLWEVFLFAAYILMVVTAVAGFLVIVLLGSGVPR